MKVLIINQHTSNHGDEAAGIALVRALYQNYPALHINVMYNTLAGLRNTEFLSGFDNVCQYHSYSRRWFTKYRNKVKCIRFAFQFVQLIIKVPFKYILNRTFFKDLVNEFKIINKSDLIISAPSGPNIGDVYSDWSYLWKIFVAIKLGKKVVIYSPSIGSLIKDNYFSKIAIYTLKRVNFLAVRDTVSESNLDKLKINYLRSIDTAFLDVFKLKKLPIELHFLNKIKYIIFVPNQLYRYIPNYSQIDDYYLDSLFIEIIRSFETENINLVLLPQLFGEQSDFTYFQKLISELPDSFIDRIFILSENYNSDVQQFIISKAEYVIGARYHSIVFSIRSETPFFCISYEHKMTGMLEKLKLSEFFIDINNYLSKSISKEYIIEKIKKCYSNREDHQLHDASNYAKQLAKDTFLSMKNIIG